MYRGYHHHHITGLRYTFGFGSILISGYLPSFLKHSTIYTNRRISSNATINPISILKSHSIQPPINKIYFNNIEV